MTRDDLGVAVTLEREGGARGGCGDEDEGFEDCSLVVEAAHAPHGRAGRVSQRTTIPLRWTAFAQRRWHHVHVEARGRPRLSLFGRDELSVWIDGESVLARCSFLFPIAISGYAYSGKAVKTHALDNCALGRGLDGQIGATYVLAECVGCAARDALSARYAQRRARARLPRETAARSAGVLDSC